MNLSLASLELGREELLRQLMTIAKANGCDLLYSLDVAANHPVSGTPEVLGSGALQLTVMANTAGPSPLPSVPKPTDRRPLLLSVGC